MTTTTTRSGALSIGEQDAIASALAPVKADKLAHGIAQRIAAGQLAVVRLPEGQTTPETYGANLLAWACIARQMDGSASGEHTLAAVLRQLARELNRGTVCLVSLDDWRAQLEDDESSEVWPAVRPEPVPFEQPRARRYGQGWAAGPLGTVYGDHSHALTHAQVMAGQAVAWQRLQQESA
ncbi:hypothetical protein [Synechococcus sp. HK01-R]|uniref:hypothetical protein n=1 Tax=Synechococcus sp. HK01-R TaxID=2751171 RepID=UPI0016269493|nr:hypothetical protein [Synechococcus sp. HK01-R]QNG26078.1 hypothetical protein H0O21_07100 [Synechococcus sp. HK01-R]